MKRIKPSVLIGVILVCLIGVVLFLVVRLRDKGALIQTRATFLGFTNKVAGAPHTNALFSFNRPPPGPTIWLVSDISVRTGTNWRAQVTLPTTQIERVQLLSDSNSGPPALVFFGTVPVISTTAPTRVVWRLVPAPGRIGQMWLNVVSVFPRSRTTGGNPFPGMPGYLMTNEFNPGASLAPAGR